MVDRITPATGPREINDCREVFGVDDNCPVYCEEFKQWVLEDTFVSGRPALEKVGVTFVHNVAPYEMVKIRILNGGHATIAYPGELLDIHYVHDAMRDSHVGGFLAKVEHEEIVPSVPPVPHTDLAAYFAVVQKRFMNPRIADAIPRLAYDGSNRQPKFIVPAIRDRLRAGASVDGLALVSAMWCRHCSGVSDSGRIIPASDPGWELLSNTSRAAKSDPRAWIAMPHIYGDLRDSTKFVDAFARGLNSLWESGTRATLDRHIRGGHDHKHSADVRLSDEIAGKRSRFTIKI